MAHKTENSSKIKIISGKWKRSNIYFPVKEDLRPTLSRIRETLFDWLAPYIEGTVCLDLYAGSGALGFEALSRGAAKVFLIDEDPALIYAMRENAAKLHTTNCEIILGHFPDNLPVFHKRYFNLVFLDPPYNQDLMQPSIQWLEKNDYLKDEAFIYAECAKDNCTVQVPENWSVWRESHTKSLIYRLYRRTKVS